MTRHVHANPYAWPFNGDLRPDNTALLVIDMQTDFCGVGGYVEKMGYDMRIDELERFLTNTQAVAAHVNAKAIETEKARSTLFQQNYTLRAELSRVTELNSGLAHDTSEKFSPAQMEEYRLRLSTEHESRFTATRSEMQTALGSAQADIHKLKQDLLTASVGLVTTALQVDPDSAQASFIKTLRTRVDTLSHERDTYKRGTEDYITQLRQADDTIQSASA